MAQTKSRRVSDSAMNRFNKPASSIGGDGNTIKSNAQIVAHGLNPLVVPPFQPRQGRIPREVIRPALKGLGHLNAQFLGTPPDRSAWIRCENVGPKLGTGVASADVTDEIDCFLAFCFAFSRKTENNVEGRTDTGSETLFGCQIHGFDFLKIFIHEVQ